MCGGHLCPQVASWRNGPSLRPGEKIFSSLFCQSSPNHLSSMFQAAGTRNKHGAKSSWSLPALEEVRRKPWTVMCPGPCALVRLPVESGHHGPKTSRKQSPRAFSYERRQPLRCSDSPFSGSEAGARALTSAGTNVHLFCPVCLCAQQTPFPSLILSLFLSSS